jgi:DNA-binding SARP family transcriptional activator
MRPATAVGRRVNLLGRPNVEARRPGYSMRSRKSWALLAYLLMCERAPTRRELASLLFEGADDPLRALRWCLSEVRRALGGDAVIAGDPVRLQLSPSVIVDVSLVLAGPSQEAIRAPGLGSELLEGLTVQDAFEFESWLLAARRRVAVATVQVLREAALTAVRQGAYETAIGHAVRLSALTRLDEDSHALLVELYRLVGDDRAAQRQYAIGAGILRVELGEAPGHALRNALCQSLLQLVGKYGNRPQVLMGPAQHGHVVQALACG